jgi:hypothetical protein
MIRKNNKKYEVLEARSMELFLHISLNESWVQQWRFYTGVDNASVHTILTNKLIKEWDIQFHPTQFILQQKGCNNEDVKEIST